MGRREDGKRPASLRRCPVTFRLIAKCNCKARANEAAERGRYSQAVSGRKRDGVPRHPRNLLLALPPRCASCATPDARHNWHGSRYANAPDMVLPGICCEILQVCPLLLRLLLRGW